MEKLRQITNRCHFYTSRPGCSFLRPPRRAIPSCLKHPGDFCILNQLLRYSHPHVTTWSHPIIQIYIYRKRKVSRTCSPFFLPSLSPPASSLSPFLSRFLIPRRVLFKYWNSGPCTFSPRPSKGSIDERINEIPSGSHSRFFLSSSAASLYQRDATQRLSIPRSSNVKKRTSRIHMDGTATNPRIHEADSARCLVIVEKSKPCSNDYDDECSGVRAFGCLAKRQGTSLRKFDGNSRLEFLIRLNVPFNHRLGERSAETRNNVNISNRRWRTWRFSGTSEMLNERTIGEWSNLLV